MSDSAPSDVLKRVRELLVRCESEGYTAAWLVLGAEDWMEVCRRAKAFGELDVSAGVPVLFGVRVLTMNVARHVEIIPAWPDMPKFEG